MSENIRLLIVEPGQLLRDQNLGLRIDRTRAINAIKSSGAKIRHDSGGRLIVVEIPEDEEFPGDRLAGFRLVPVESNVKDSIAGLDANELLFLEALKIRNSKKYRDAKKRRKVGESPEEKALASGSCIREY